MRDDAEGRVPMLSPITPDHLVPVHHPIAEIRAIVERALSALCLRSIACIRLTGARRLRPSTC